MTNPLVLTSVANDDSLLVAALDKNEFSSAVFRWNEAGLTARVVRGRKMTRFSGLMDEFAAALQFPSYFGENWPAFQECLEDMEWLPAGKGIVIAVADAGQVLSDEPDVELRVLIRSFARAHASYASPIADNEWWDRPAIPFHVVLQASPDSSGDLLEWLDAGASLKTFPSK